jgi:exosome complex RNA-binding protein Csl4
MGVKQVQCARCGTELTVPDVFNVFEYAALCPECDAHEWEKFERELGQ